MVPEVSWVGRDLRCPWPAPPPIGRTFRQERAVGSEGMAGSGEPVVWPEWGGPLQTGMKYLEAHVPGKWKLPSKMKC